MNKQHGDVHLFPVIDAAVRRIIQDGLFFAPWIGNVETMLQSNTDGTVERVIKSTSGSIVERVEGFMKAGADEALMPLVKELEEKPMYGNAYYPGTGEKLRYMWRKVFINQIGKVVEQENGPLSKLREKNLEKSYKLALPQLIRYIKKWLNAEFISTYFEGHSMAVTEGTDLSPEGIGAKAVLHPNLYTNTVDPSTGGSLTVIGTEKYNKKVSEMTTAIETNYADIKLPSPKFLDKVGEKLDELSIQKAATYKGKKYWLAVISRPILSKLKADDTFRKDIREAFMGLEYDNPLFNHDTWIADEFMFCLDKRVCRAWNNDTLNFAGTNGYIGLPTFTSAKDHAIMNVYGRNAFGLADVIPYETVADTDNFGFIKELLAWTIMGLGRGEFVNKTDEATYFATSQATKATLDSAVEVFNQSSAGFAVKI